MENKVSLPEKSHSFLIVGPDHGQDDGLLLPSLESVNRFDLEVREVLLQLRSQEFSLRGVGGHYPDILTLDASI